MTGEKGGLLAGLRAEALKSRHAAPVRLAVLMALPMPLLGAMPYRGVQIFSAWNYWYALFLPVSLSLVVACVARADARTRMRGLLGLGFPLGASMVGQGALVPRSLHALEPRGLRHLPRGIGVLLAGSHGRGHAHDAPLRARQHGDRGVDDPRRALLSTARRVAASCPLARSSWVGSPGRWCRSRSSFRRRRAWSSPRASFPCCRAASRSRRTWRSAGRSRRTACSRWRALRSRARVRRAHGGGRGWFARSEER